MISVEYNLLRSVAVKTVRHLGVVGECNIQFTLNPNSREVQKQLLVDNVLISSITIIERTSLLFSIIVYKMNNENNNKNNMKC